MLQSFHLVHLSTNQHGHGLQHTGWTHRHTKSCTGGGKYDLFGVKALQITSHDEAEILLTVHKTPEDTRLKKKKLFEVEVLYSLVVQKSVWKRARFELTAKLRITINSSNIIFNAKLEFSVQVSETLALPTSSS